VGYFLIHFDRLSLHSQTIIYRAEMLDRWVQGASARRMRFASRHSARLRGEQVFRFRLLRDGSGRSLRFDDDMVLQHSREKPRSGAKKHHPGINCVTRLKYPWPNVGN
jgi:hypothetical protein